MNIAAATDTRNTEPATETGLVLVADNHDALAVRVLCARYAAATLDLMYYIWRDDHCGRALLAEVVAAADRGVRVRMLIDDINPQSSDATYLALNSHPNIELRLFNPSAARNGSLLRKVELVSRMFSMTRRMHGKAWIADRDIAVVGGRNIGDEYFDAAETNFRDLDLLMVGAAVGDACSIFDAYWNHVAAKPVQTLNPAAKPKTRRLGRIRAPDGLARMPDAGDSIGDFLARRTVHRVGNVKVIADPPDKVFGRGRDNWLVRELAPILASARRKLDIVSPYFIPGEQGVRLLKTLVEDGVDVAIVTNSLAATDVAAVHGAYANYRVDVLRAGVKLFEFRPFTDAGKMTMFGSRGASLHTKAFVLDGRVGFVGSFNFDPRSVSLNAEMGLLFEDEALAAQLTAHIQIDKLSNTSFAVSLQRGKLAWTSLEDGKIRHFRSEPEASLKRRLISGAIAWLPIESQL